MRWVGLSSNTVTSFAEDKLNLLFKDEYYIDILYQIYVKDKEISKEYSSYYKFDNKNCKEALTISKNIKKIINEKTKLVKSKNKILKDYNLTEYSLQAFLKEKRYKYDHLIDANVGQKIASAVFQGVQKILDGEGKKLNYKKFGTMTSLEGKTNDTSMRLLQVKGTDIHNFNKSLRKKHDQRNKKLNKNMRKEYEYTKKFHGMNIGEWYMRWGNIIIPVFVDSKDNYAQESLKTKRIKYCRIIKKYKNNKEVFYIQAVLEGAPIIKVNKNNKPLHIIYALKNPYEEIVMPVGIDIGTSTIAICSFETLYYDVLAPNVDNIQPTLRRALRKLDRSRRISNPDNYYIDGRVKWKDRAPWIKTKNYMKTLFKVKDLYRKAAATRKQRHCELANFILTLGHAFYVEKMNFKALQKRAKKTEISTKTGRYKKKKRFGKSLLNHSPSAFLGILKYKLKYAGLNLNVVNTYSFKASKYNHISDTFLDIDLSDRWKIIDNNIINRDLYSAFLLMNSNKELTFTDKESCKNNYGSFLIKHNKLIKELKSNGKKYPKSFGLNDINNDLKLINA